MEKVRNIKLFKNYYKEFYVAQTFEVRDKINKVLKLIETQRIIPAKFFRIIEGTDGIYGIRYDRGEEAGNHELRDVRRIARSRIWFTGYTKAYNF